MTSHRGATDASDRSFPIPLGRSDYRGQPALMHKVSSAPVVLPHEPRRSKFAGDEVRPSPVRRYSAPNWCRYRVGPVGLDGLAVASRFPALPDWQSACVGPPSVDIGHCRANFLLYAPELADRYTAAAERALGRQFHPWADIAALIGMLDGLRRTPPRRAGRIAVENALLRATSEL
jgi:hypothetical protein